MSHNVRGSDAPLGAVGAFSGWVVALALAIICSSNFVADRLATRDFEADEIHCRSKQKEEYARQKVATSGIRPTAAPNSEDDPEKIARDYCIQRRAAIAGETQAEIARTAAAVSYVALVAALAAIAVAVWAAKATHDTAKHAADAAIASEKSLLISQRPWLSVEPKLGEYGLQFYVGQELRLVLDLLLWNNGRSPADDIQIFAKFCPLRMDAREEFNRLRTAAKAGVAMAAPLLYKPLFPKDMETYPLPIYLSSADIVRILPRTTDNWIDPAVVGCVLYKSPFAPDQVHDTGFIVELTDGRDPSAGRPFKVSNEGFLLSGEVPAGNLNLYNVYFPRSLS